MTDYKGRPSLTNKAALVTDIGSPMGYAVAEALVKAGARVHGVNANHDQCVDQINCLRQWGKASGHVADLRNAMSTLQLARLVNEELPQLHLVVSTVRIAEASDAADLIREVSQGNVEILGELAFIQELLPALRVASTVAVPARVVLVGDFSHSPTQLKPATRTKEIATRLAEHRVNLNLIDLGLVNGATESAAAFFVLSALMGLLSSDASAQKVEIEGFLH